LTINARGQLEPAPSLIYVVDDDADLREEMILGLSRLGLDAHGFHSAAALYRAFAAKAPDIVVLDIGLDDEDGLSVASHLRALSSLGIIMATGRGSIEDRVQGLQAGADAYLVKPVDIRELAAIAVALNQRLSDRRTSPSPKHPRWTLEQGGWVLSARGEIVERRAIIEAMGGDVYDFNYAHLDTIASRLRQRAKKHGMTLPLHAVRGLGFAFTD
jgi:DNA-binding response OmpR family regulator